MALDDIRIAARIVVAEMRANRLHDVADEISGLLAEIDAPATREAALMGLVGFCDPKAFGDFYIPAMSWEAWLAHLARLEKACRRELTRGTLEVVDGEAAPPPPPPAPSAVPAHGESPRAAVSHEDLTLLGCLALVLTIAFFYAAIHVGARLPAWRVAETVEVTGALERREGSGTLRGASTWLVLKRDAVIYRIPESGEFAWADDRSALREGADLRLTVDRDQYERARAVQDGLVEAAHEARDRDPESRALGFLPARQLAAGWDNAVRVYELRAGKAVLFSRLSMLPDQRRVAQAWGIVASACLAALAGIAFFHFAGVRRRAPSEPTR